MEVYKEPLIIFSKFMNFHEGIFFKNKIQLKVQ